MPDIQKVLTGMGYLILVFLLVSRSSEVSSVIKSIGGFVTTQTQALQGVSPYGGIIH